MVLFEERRVDRARADAIDAETVSRVVDREGSRELEHAALRGAVRGHL